MIKGISPGTFIDITGGNASSTYVSNNYGAQGVGNMRFNTTTQNIEVYDGNSWQIMSVAHPSISLNSSAVSAITWVMNKMAEEESLQKLSRENPAVKIAYENLQRAQEQLKATIILSKDEQTTT